MYLDILEYAYILLNNSLVKEEVMIVIKIFRKKL